MQLRPLFYFVSALFIFSSFCAHADPRTEAKVEQVVSESGQININTASAKELQKLKGIGKKRAEQIVKDREVNGPFTSAQDLTRIKGIGKKTVEKNVAAIITGQDPKPTKPSIKHQKSPVQIKK